MTLFFKGLTWWVALSIYLSASVYPIGDSVDARCSRFGQGRVRTFLQRVTHPRQHLGVIRTRATVSATAVESVGPPAAKAPTFKAPL